MSAPIVSRFPAARWIKSFIKSFKESNDTTTEPDAKKIYIIAGVYTLKRPERERRYEP